MAKTSPIRRSTMRSERQSGVQKPPNVWKRAHGAMRQIPHASSRSMTRANSRSEERAASHPLPAPCGPWRLSSALRLRRATSPTSRRAASGLRRESHDEPKVQRTRSMTGNVAIDTKLTAEGYGGQSGSAYRRSGRFTHRESTRATGPAQAPARICRERKRRPKMRDVRNDTGGGRQRNTENDERGLSR
jgi:hypothetical protein